MQITQGTIATIHYKVRVDAETIEQTDKPIAYMHGAGMLLPAVERNLEGCDAGVRLIFALSPEDAYGPRDEGNVVTLPRSIFPAHVDLAVGARLAARTYDGDVYPLTVAEVFADRVKVDLNHPLAGKTLNFEIDVITVRRSTAQEILAQRALPDEPITPVEVV